MGSPISGLIAEAVLQRLERVVFAVTSPRFWKRYFDDTFVIIKQDNLSAFHQLINTTMETATENKLPFWDELVRKLPSVDVRNIGVQKGNKCGHRPPLR